MRRINLNDFQIARRGTAREINRQIALNFIRARQPISRADLARLMGIRRGAVSLLVNELLENGLVFQGAKGQSKRGRKPTHLYIDTRRRCALAVDVSASRTSIMVTDLLGQPLLAPFQFPTGRQPEFLLRKLVRHIARIRREQARFGECVGVGVVVSGMVDVESGLFKYSPTLGWRDVDLRTPLQSATGLPVVIENSVKACMLAQVWALGADVPGDGPVAFVNVSDGVGVGIAIDGKLLRGVHNIAGELGHVPLSVHGPRCSCGQSGCWEAYVSKRATVARYLARDPSFPASARPQEVTLEDLIARARDGEGRALDSLRETGFYLGWGLSTIVKAIDPRRVYLGGEITAAWDLIEPAVRQTLRDRALIAEAGETEIFTVPLGDHPRLRGAAALVSAPAFAAPTVA
jgi:predicted NBD/HSP70 family sugar kinase